MISQESKTSQDNTKNLRAELQQLDIFKKNNGAQKHVAVSPNVSNESPVMDSQASLNNFIDMHMKHNFVINEQLSSFKSESG